MKTIEEMISVMRGYADGKKIECKSITGTSWGDTARPSWDWYSYDYRIKPEPKYRPYKNADEFYHDVVKHGGWVKSADDSDSDYGTYYWHIIMFTDEYVNFLSCDGDYDETYDSVLCNNVWADDGSVCGVLEEE